MEGFRIFTYYEWLIFGAKLVGLYSRLARGCYGLGPGTICRDVWVGFGKYACRTPVSCSCCQQATIAISHQKYSPQNKGSRCEEK